ncbi:homeotic protein female sterile [Fagus crenata]
MQYATPPPMKREQQPHQQPNQASAIPCGGCGSSERWPLHTVRHRGSYRRLCTDCVLKNHQSLFCPLCLLVFDETPPPLPDRLVCLNCPSIAHRSCAPPDSTTSFLCPPCTNPNFSFFFSDSDSDPNPNPKRIKTEDGGVPFRRNTCNTTKAIDKDSSKALLAAARIASASMNKAAATAQSDAERRVREAALAKKKAKEALEHLAFLVLKDNNNKDDHNQDSKPLPAPTTKPIQTAMRNKASSPDAVKATNGLHSLSAAAAVFSQQSTSHATKDSNRL